MKKFFKILLIVVIVLLFGGTFLFLWNKSKPTIVMYEHVSPIVGTIQTKSIATGQIEPRDEVLIKPQISGIVSEVYKEAGDEVKAGDVIALVKVIPEIGTLNAAQSRVNVAKIAMEQSEKDFSRAKRLYNDGVSSKEEYEKAEVEHKRAIEELQTAKDNFEIVRDGIAGSSKQFSNTQIRTTVNGMILDVPIKVGNSVIPSNNFNDGTTIATIADMSNMIFRGKMDEAEVGQLKMGMPMTLTIGALRDVKIDAVLEYISPKSLVENGAVLFEIKAAVSIPDSLFIRSGYSANAEIVLQKKENIMTLPEGVVEFINDSTFVYLLTDSISIPQNYKKTAVKLGLSNGLNIEIKSGITLTDRIRSNPKINK